MKSPHTPKSNRRSGKMKAVGATALGALTFGAGCTMPHRYKLNEDYHTDFKNMVTDYQVESARLAAADRTMQNSVAGETPKVIALAEDPIAKGVRVQADLPTKETTLEELFISAIQNSSQIKVFSELPLIRQTSIQEARGAFDITAFVEGKYDSVNDPVGSTLTTGGASRLEEEKLGFRAGLKKKIETGAEVYATQELKRTDSNSTFFTPNPQVEARLTVGVVQPLLNGAGIGYNRSIIRIAKIDSQIARQEFLRQVESHLLEITRTYWGLYMARGVYQAKERASQEADKTLKDLESRNNFDAIEQQILRARAASAERRADLVRSESAVRSAEDRLKALVNDPSTREVSAIEIIPMDKPVLDRTVADLEQAASAALQNRPEVQQAFLQLKASAIRRDMSRNEMMPVLNLMLEGYVAALRRDDWTGPLNDQFDPMRPGYSVGLRLEYPLGNNQAEARNMRRRLEMRQLVSQLRTTMETVLLEVKVSMREVHTSYRDLSAKYDSMLAAREDLEHLQKRREAMFLGGDTTAISYIEYVIDAQQRRATAEENFLRAVATYNVALTTLERSKGNLLAYETIAPVKVKVKDGDPYRSWIEHRWVPQYLLKTGQPQKPLNIYEPDLDGFLAADRFDGPQPPRRPYYFIDVNAEAKAKQAELKQEPIRNPYPDRNPAQPDAPAAAESSAPAASTDSGFRNGPRAD
jgi:outer membrane protein TolC